METAVQHNASRPALPLFERLRAWKLHILPGASRPLFILGHMRSGSSLLVHLLTSHPDIAGYGETHRVYTSPADFSLLRRDVAQKLKRWKLPAWVLDKCLDPLQVADELFAERGYRFLFLIREPAGTMRSMIRQFPTWFTDRPQEPAELRRLAHANCSERLNEIQRQSALLRSPDQAVLITHDDLLHRTAASFMLLQYWLGLSRPLSESYDITPFTGAGGIGDRSVHIQAGRIERNIVQAPIPLDPSHLHTATERYQTVCEVLASRCLRPAAHSDLDAGTGEETPAMK